MTQDSTEEVSPILARQQRLLTIQKALTDTWLRNLTAETALPIMGHVLLGAALDDKEKPALNDKKSYLQLKPEEDYDASKITLCRESIHFTALPHVLSVDTIGDILRDIQDTVARAIAGVDVVVARSLRLLVTYEATGVMPGVHYTLAWFTTKKETE